MTLPRLYDIKEAARYLGVASSTLRYWESEGLVQAGRGEANGYRQYSLHDLIEASEIAFYRKLGVPVKELRGYRALSARSLDEALARTEDGVEQRIAELEATKARLARQRALNAKAEELRRAGMQPGSPAIGSLSAIDYDAAAPWKLLVEEPVALRGGRSLRYKPDEVYESAVDAGAQDGAVLWRRSSAHDETTCRECLLKVSPLRRSTPPRCRRAPPRHRASGGGGKLPSDGIGRNRTLGLPSRLGGGGNAARSRRRPVSPGDIRHAGAKKPPPSGEGFAASGRGRS